MNWTPEQVAAAEKRIAGNMVRPPTPFPPADEGAKQVVQPRGANKWETLFGEQLDLRRQAGEVIWYAFQPMRFKIASFRLDNRERTAWYTPDWAALELRPGELLAPQLVLYEVKGHWREAARVRIKCAASQYPFPFVAATSERREWIYEEFYRPLLSRK